MAADTKLALVDLTKRYAPGLEPAVKDLNMSVEPGHLVALLGPSGCGKTTTLRMVAGLMDPTSGAIVVDGKDITMTPVHQRGMGMVFQSYALFPHMNVLDNVAFGLKMRKRPREEQRRLAAEALELVKLGHLSGRRVKELSGGQQQRVALARALVVEPTLLLLDEPLSNLDAKLRESMRYEIRTIQQRTGATTLFVTHDQDEALDMADRIAVMNGGLIEQFGSPTEVYERPQTRFVADFIGHANLVEVDVIDDLGADSGHYRRYSVADPQLGQHQAIGIPGLGGSRRVLLVRPHHVTVSREEPATGAAAVTRAQGTVTSMSYTGDVISYRVAVGAMQIMADVTPQAGSMPGAGDSVHVSWAAADAYLLPETQEK